jgi:hypothetical protein
MNTSDRPRTFNGDLQHLPAALLPLTQEQRFVIWRWEWRARKGGGGKWTKPPYQTRYPREPAKSNDPATWGSYQDAVAAVAAGEADGIGFMLKDASVGAVDLDHVRDPDTGQLVGWAAALSAEADGAYREPTVSGGGLRLIGVARGSEIHRKFTFDRATGAGVELYRNCARYITISGLQLGECSELPVIDGLLDALFARYSGTAQANGHDFNEAGRQQSSIDYDELIENGAPEGERSELFQAVVWHLAAKGWTAEQITDELARHPNGIGAKYADRLHAEVARSYEKWRSRQHAAATGGAASSPWPQIYIKNGELPRVVNEAEDALLLLGREIYQRGGLVVRPVLTKLKAADDRDMQGWRLIPVTQPYLIETLTCAARFLKHDARSKAWVAVNAPDRVAQTYLARQGTWKLPILSGIVHTPFLRADGSLCEQPGYDPASGLLFKPDRESFPPVPREPSKNDALAALATLDHLLATFPFVGEADRTVALSAILTALDRRAMATAPLHAFTSPTAGTGKSLLVDMVAMLATGQLMPVISQGKTEEELEKRLGAALLAGDVVISLDNCEHRLESTFLCQALTQEKLNIRMLGLSRNVETPVNATIFATGNNLTIAGDLVRRSLMCSLDAKCERPELRTFNVDAIKTVRGNRGRLVTAALTVLRAWQVAREREALSLPPLGSFEQWSRRIREPLVWLGRADPCGTIDRVRENDPTREALWTVVVQWEEHLGHEQKYAVQDVIRLAAPEADFQTALVAVASNQKGLLVSNDRLGRWLKKVQGKERGPRGKREQLLPLASRQHPRLPALEVEQIEQDVRRP